MTKPAIVCVEDQREVLAALLKDLEELTSHFDVVDCESADDAWEAIDELDAEGAAIALIVSDHVMPGKNGVAFLTEIVQDGRFAKTRKLLLTGLATHEDTIRAINQARIDSYLKKPWAKDELLTVIRRLLTHFIFDAGLNYLDFPGMIDQDVLLNRMQ